MAFFKFRKGGDEQSAPAAPAAESVEALRTRARHRLIGAAVLVLVGVVGFPLLFDSQPRPVAVDIPIEIPDQDKVKPLVLGAAGKTSAAASAVVDERAAPVAAPATAPKAPTPKVATPTPKVVEKPAPKAAEKPVAKPVAPSTTASAPASTNAARAQALLDGKEPEKAVEKPTDKVPTTAAAMAGRFVVQVGAYADVVKAREARAKLEKAGLQTYTQVVQPKEGKRIRVRVGPFETRAEAEKAADKIKKLELSASILEL